MAWSVRVCIHIYIMLIEVWVQHYSGLRFESTSQKEAMMRLMSKQDKTLMRVKESCSYDRMSH